MKYIASVNQNECVACGACVKTCPKQALSIYKGVFAQVDAGKCVGCGLCVKACPASVIQKTEVTVA